MHYHKPDEYGQRDDAGVTLYDRYAHIIFAYMRLHINSRDDAEDLTLEVFVAALEQDNLSTIPPDEQLAWLRRVAHNKLVDSYRRFHRRPVVALEEVVDIMLDDEAQAPEQVAIRHEEQSQLYKAVKRLSTLQQQLLRLRYGDGLRFADIALLLDKREEALRKLLSRTLQELRTIYSQY